MIAKLQGWESVVVYRSDRGRILIHSGASGMIRLLAGLAILGWALAGPAGAGPIQIMPLGDSITWGYAGYNSPVDPGGYRGRLYTDLTNAGYAVQFVGSTTENPTPGLPADAQAQEGHIGYAIANGTAAIPTIGDNLNSWLGPNGAHPDIVLLMIGANNILGNYDVEAAPYQLGALVKRITELDPKAHVFVSTLTPLVRPEWEAEVQSFNAKISGPDGVIAGLQKAGVNVTLVDIGSQLTLADTDDGAHPSPAGYDKMATAWADALEGKPLPPAVTPEPSAAFLIGGGALAWFWRARGRGRSLRPVAAALALGLVGLLAGGDRARAATIQIMPLGDSITWGYPGSLNPPDPGGYRGRLYTDLTNDGLSVQMVGSSTENPDTTLPAAAQSHEGHIGDVIDNTDATNQSIAGNVATWLGPNGAHPDDVLLLIGINNIIANHDVQDAPYQLGALIKHITELDPKAHVFVSTLIPIYYAPWESQVQTFNARISGPDGVIAGLQQAGVNVTLVDIGHQLTLADTADGIHPSAVGYTKMATAWADAIEGKGLPPGVTPEPSAAFLIGGGALAWLWSRRRRGVGGVAVVLALGWIGVGRPSEAAATSVRVMALGDSITYGYEGYNIPADPGGYRATLYRDLVASGFSPQFVGSETLNADPTLPAAAAAQEGHIGYLIEGPATNGTPGLSENVAKWLGPGGADPQLILLMIGANNASSGYRSEGAPYALAALITQITRLKPDARVIVSTLTPMVNADAEARVEAFNKSLGGPDGIVAQLQKLGEKVSLADVGASLTTADLIDGLHPTAEGYTKLGNAWFAAVESSNGTTVPEPPAVACFAIPPLVGLVARLRARKGTP